MTTSTTTSTTTSQDTQDVSRTSVAARGVIRHGGRLLLVTDGAGYWYAPGGRMEPGETLPACLAREVYEETGLTVQVGDVLAVSEYLDPDGEHKIECFFDATLQDAGQVLAPWQDTGGPVTSFALFDDVELAGMDVRPAFLTTLLAEGPGRTERSMPVYIPAGHATVATAISHMTQ
jgi:8-oxo-dGTP diphosphatase